MVHTIYPPIDSSACRCNFADKHQQPKHDSDDRKNTLCQVKMLAAASKTAVDSESSDTLKSPEKPSEDASSVHNESEEVEAPGWP